MPWKTRKIYQRGIARRIKIVEEIFNYKAPIAVIPDISLAKADLNKWKGKRKRCSKEESIKVCDMEIDRARARVESLQRAKG